MQCSSEEVQGSNNFAFLFIGSEVLMLFLLFSIFIVMNMCVHVKLDGYYADPALHPHS